MVSFIEYFAVNWKFLYDLPPCSLAASTTMPLNDNFVYAPPQDPLSILFEDDDLVVVDKPAGLLSVMGRLPEHHDSAYLRVLEKFPLAKVTHRLDMATSGLLMFAKHRDAEVAVSKMFQARTVKSTILP